MTAVRELLSRRSDIELEFVRHRTSGVVHVVAPRDPDQHGTEYRFGDVPAELMLAVALGTLPTLCGYLARQNLGSAQGGDQKITGFDDAALCPRCWRALGPDHRARAFEHPQPATTAGESGS